ncbi:MAG: DUF6493 family protein [Arachnia propionica]|uniref:DUF6493 family protein n=1 Tax=Arachnia propionica TaxID=1750 RepID=UPI00270CF926|nr:DUF6493 family protein [Arachnia propionica]
MQDFNHTHIDELSRIVSRPGGTLRDLYDLLLLRETEPWQTHSAREMIEWQATRFSSWDHFTPIRLAELFDGLQVPHDEAYVLAMVSATGASHTPGLREFLLRHDEDLRENVFWRIFEVEGGGEVSLTNVDKFSPEPMRWRTTVVTLVGEGVLDRTRLLRSCVAALNRDFSSYRAGWFTGTWTALAPTPVEVAANQDLLLRALGSTVAATVSFAMKNLGIIHRAGQLDVSAFVDAAGPALAGGKATAAAALKVLASLPGTSEVIAHALTHPHEDIQLIAARILAGQGRGDLIDPAQLSPSVAEELGLRREPEPDAPPIKPTAGIRAPEAILPVTDDDALTRVAALMEDPGDPLELELALSWLASTPDAATVLEPLRQRARSLGRPNRQDLFPQLILAALSPTQERDASWNEPSRRWEFGWLPASSMRHLDWFLLSRLAEVADILTGRVPHHELLATPTDNHGNLDADALLRRLDMAAAVLGVATRELPAHRPADLTQAAMRLNEADRKRVSQVVGVELPAPTRRVRIDWEVRQQEVVRPDDDRELPNPPPWYQILVPSRYSALTALMDPAGTCYLVARGLAPHELIDYGSHLAEVLPQLLGHPGAWTPETAQLLAFALSGKSEIQALAVELLVAVVPGRLGVEDTAAGMAAAAPVCVLNRWTSSLTDAAALNPGMVVDLLTALLPRVDRGLRGIGGLLQLLLDEQLRLGRVTEDGALREWLAGFTGSSAAAKTAKKLLAAS